MFRGEGLADLWVDAPSFDLNDHVRVLPLPADSGEAELLVAIERLRRQRLDPSRPLWELWFLPGLPNNQIALFVRLHHAIADGMAAIGTIARCSTPRRTRPPHRLPRGRPRDRRRHASCSPTTSWATSNGSPARSRRLPGLGPPCGGCGRRGRRPASSSRSSRDQDQPGPHGRSRPHLALIRPPSRRSRVAHHHGATVNDVLLAAGRRPARAPATRGEPVQDTTVRIYVPVSLRLRRGLRGPQQGNLIAQMAVPLPLGESEPGRRLERIAAETAKAQGEGAHVAGDAVRWPDRQAAAAVAVIRQRVNATSASIPGPEVPLMPGRGCWRCSRCCP